MVLNYETFRTENVWLRAGGALQSSQSVRARIERAAP